MPAQPSNGFLNAQPDPLHIKNLHMLAQGENVFFA